MYNRILLIPHASDFFSGDATRNAVKNTIPYMNKLYIVSTWHGRDNEHSWKWSKESLATTYLKPLLNDAQVRYAKPKMAKKILEETFKVITTEPETLLIFNSDLTHYGINYGHPDGTQELSRKLDREQPLLQSLSNPSRGLQVEQMGNELPCGIVALEILNQLTMKLGYIGKIFDYYDSSNVSGDTSSWVSYVSMGFHPDNQCDSKSSFLERFPECRNKTNPIFLGFKSLLDGKTRASIGRIDSTSSIQSKIQDIIPSLKKDFQSGRLGGGTALCDTFIYVNILEKNWKTVSLNRLTTINNNQGYHGVQCIWSNRSSIFIPSVWRENPNWTIYDILENLSVKAGLPPDAWKDSQKIQVFKEVGIFT